MMKKKECVDIPLKNKRYLLTPDNRRLLLLVYSVLLCIIGGDRLIVELTVVSTETFLTSGQPGFTSFLSI